MARGPFGCGAWDAVFAAGLAVLVWLAYGPSVRHAPRADQWAFLVDTLDEPTFAGTLRASYSYNRTRTIAPGDTDLFRPVLFAVLAAEKAAFGFDLAGPQYVGIGLHYGVCLLLFAVLRRIVGRCPLTYTVTLFFALNPAVQELVVWTHLHGYLLFLLLLLGAVYLLLAGVDGDAVRPAPLAGAWGLLLVASFTYEMGQFAAVLAGLYVAAAVAPRAGRLRAAGWFAAFAGRAAGLPDGQRTGPPGARRHPRPGRGRNARCSTGW